MRSKLFRRIRHKNGHSYFQAILEESDNLNWLPGLESIENYSIDLPNSLDVGKYYLKIKMQYEGSETRPVLIGLKPELKDHEGFYRLKEITIQ